MKKLACFLVIAAIAVFIANPVSALMSAKATAQFTNITGVIIAPSETAWTTVLEQKIKTPNNKDLFIDASFEVGLTTSTAVMSKKLERAIAEAEAQVKVRVLLDDVVVVEPGEVIFSRRAQTLVAEFAGLYDLWDEDCVQITYACIPANPLLPPYNPDVVTGDCIEGDTMVVTGITFSEGAACFDAEFLQLILDTMAAHSFNFIAVDVPTGIHTIKVQVQLDYDLGDGVGIYDRPDLADDVLEWSASGSAAWIGKGSVTIESVRMIKNDGADEPPEI